MTAESWEHFEHEADMGVRGRGATREAAFEAAALALTAVVTDPAGVAAAEAVQVECTAPDDEMLLVDWLNALVYEMAVRRMLFGRFRVRIQDSPRDEGTPPQDPNALLRLQGEAWGEPVSRSRHQPAVEVKGATFTSLRVAREGDGWVAQCVVDV